LHPTKPLFDAVDEVGERSRVALGRHHRPMGELVFGPGSPYGRMPAGLIAD
jgi:hypothetical protein